MNGPFGDRFFMNTRVYRQSLMPALFLLLADFLSIMIKGLREKRGSV